MITVKMLKPGVNFTPEVKIRLLLDLISGITTSENLKEAFGFVMEKISQAIGWSAADVWLVDPISKNFYLGYSYCPDKRTEFFCEQSKKFSFSSEPWQEEAAKWYEDLQASDAVRKQLFKAAGLHSAITLPIPSDSKVMALFNFYSTKPLKEDEELTEYLTAIAQQLGVFLRQKRTEDELIKKERESKELSDELKKLNDHLEEKVKERTIELEQKNNELKEFAHVVSHDLKSPLRAVTMLAQWIMEDDEENRLSPASKENLELLRKQVSKMQQMITDILTVAKTGKEKLPKEHIPINEVVKEIVDTIRPPKNIKVRTCPAEPYVIYPKVHLKQIFTNLIDNAIKYMDKPHGEIDIQCMDLGNYWQLQVKDNGPGIPEKYHREVFKLFNKIPSSKPKVESTGVGLSIVKKTIESNGGKIWLESRPGEGTAFNFTIPKTR